MKINKKDAFRQNISRTLLVLLATVTPLLVSAQNVTSSSSSCTTQQSLCTLIYSAIGYFDEAIYLVIALAVLTFIWNVYHYFIAADPENKTEASKYVMFSVIGLFVILSFWGLVNIISNTLNLNTTATQINVQALTGGVGGTTGDGTSNNSDNSGCTNGTTFDDQPC